MRGALTKRRGTVEWPRQGRDRRGCAPAGRLHHRRDGFRYVDPGPTNAHMGALMTDAVLQTCIAYETVVKPRVMRVARDERTRTWTGFSKC